MKPKTAVLLLNVGTPDSPTTPKVRKYLFEFLNDPRVIDLPWLLRKILVNLIIVPFRAPKSAKLYQRLWTEEGSPLLFHGISLQNKVQEKLGNGYIVQLAMNYQNPNIKDVLKKLLKKNITRIIAFPLFPHYASSSTGTVIEKVLNIVAKENNIPAISTILQYYDEPLYMDALVSSVLKYDYQKYDHILMSYHGIPVRQINKSHNGRPCDEFNCTAEVNEDNLYCYHASCYATSRLLMKRLNIPEDKVTVCFQSRLTKNWLKPFTDQVVANLAAEGKKRILVICPAFTADCLETTVEVGYEYKELFIKAGGKELTLVESLNDSDEWVNAITEIISKKME